MTAAARDEQRKLIKYNHLVANLLIFHTAIGMTRALDSIAADGFGDAVNPEGIATFEPPTTERINRFGHYVLDMSLVPAPLPFALPQRHRRGVRPPKLPMCDDLDAGARGPVAMPRIARSDSRIYTGCD